MAEVVAADDGVKMFIDAVVYRSLAVSNSLDNTVTRNQNPTCSNSPGSNDDAEVGGGRDMVWLDECGRGEEGQRTVGEQASIVMGESSTGAELLTSSMNDKSGACSDG